MQIFVDNNAGRLFLELIGEKRSLPLYNNRICFVLAEGESIRVDSGLFCETFMGSGEYFLPIVWDADNRCNVSIRTGKSILKYQFSLENSVPFDEDDIANLIKFFEQLENTFYLDREYSISVLFDAIKVGDVSLIIEKTPFTGYDDQSLLKKISETVPMVMDICSHPKQSLRSEEAVLDVNLVKRINSRTMDHLSSHSEHWKARTLTGLIPNRLRADIFEDEINIYENLFFRMAVDDILKYVHGQAESIRKTIEQNTNAIDWNAYGQDLADYKRMKIFEQLLPDYDISERQNENKALQTLFDQWNKLEKNFSTVEASQFFRSIDKKKHISRNIQPTNILKKDSRYNALYRVWCDIQRQSVKEQQESVNLNGIQEISLSNCYSMYVLVLLLYSFKLLDCQISENSTFKLTVDGFIECNAYFSSKLMNYVVVSKLSANGVPDISIKYIEKTSYSYQIPDIAKSHIDSIASNLPRTAELNTDKSCIVFYSKPIPEEEKVIKNLFHVNMTEKKKMSSTEIAEMKEIDKIWRQTMEDVFSGGLIKQAKEETIQVHPDFVQFEAVEGSINRFTEALFNSTKENSVFILPIDLGNYKKCIKEERLTARLLNYGEKYYDEDALRWGNYRIGLLPVAQSEINSAQRLMKLISVHTSRLLIKWNQKKVVCPICGSLDCTEDGNYNWRCNNTNCGILFGITKHAGGCGAEYEWTRPYINIKKKDISALDYMDLMLRKDLIFDRLTITDYDFELQGDESVKYVPVCPRCGKRSAVVKIHK